MLLWILSSLFLIFGTQLVFEDPHLLESVLGPRRGRQKLIEVVNRLSELEEFLMAGLAPDQQRWNVLKKLDEPWGRLVSESLGELRSSGAALLPTLQRLRALAEEHLSSLEDAQAKSAQAVVQAGICAVLVPVVGFALYYLLPSLQESPKLWMLACCLACGWVAVGVLWMLRLAEAARWGGLARPHRAWILGAYCAGERFLALVRMGVPPDLAWARMSGFLAQEVSTLAELWGGTVWHPVQESFQLGKPETILVSAGHSIRRTIRTSLNEGCPCLDRVDSVLRSLRSSFKSQVDRELSLVGTQALKPLFICVAPAILGLLFFGIILSGLDALGGSDVQGIAPY